MKVLFVAQNVDHHKVPFVEALISRLGEDNVRYATPVRTDRMRIKMGFPSYASANWLMEINASTRQEFQELFDRADIVLCNIRDYYRLMEKRLKQGKPVFYFSERWFKAGIGKARLLHPRILNIVRHFHKLSSYPSFFYLAQGYYAAEDFKFMGLCKGRIFNFGYFTSVVKSRPERRILPPDKINILWCGRMMKCKRVDLLVEAFAHIHKDQPQTHLTIVGEGEEQERIDCLIDRLLPPGSFRCYGLLPVKKVRELMSEADIYVFPSNGFEGWGAVVNEAMAESCAIIGSDKAGAIRTMIETGRNGLIFPSGNGQALEEQLRYLVDHPVEMERLKQAAYQSITTEWSPGNVCDRFLLLCDAVFSGSPTHLYNEGAMKLL